MIDTGVGERPGRVGNEARPVFDALVGKLRIPSTRPGSVRRTSLIDRLVREVSRPIVSVVAPAGYGKTMLLVQWAEHSGQAVAWVSVDEQDNDSRGLLGAVARALDAVRPVDLAGVRRAGLSRQFGARLGRAAARQRLRRDDGAGAADPG